MDDLFSLDSVRDFMLSRGGRVKNHDLVTHFKSYLNDPTRKGKELNIVPCENNRCRFNLCFHNFKSLRSRSRVGVPVLGHAQNSDNATKVSNISENM